MTTPIQNLEAALADISALERMEAADWMSLFARLRSGAPWTCGQRIVAHHGRDPMGNPSWDFRFGGPTGEMAYLRGHEFNEWWYPAYRRFQLLTMAGPELPVNDLGIALLLHPRVPETVPSSVPECCAEALRARLDAALSEEPTGSFGPR